MEIKGNGFILRDWQKADAPSLQQNADNPNVSGNLLDRFPSPYTLDDAEKFIAAKNQEPHINNFAIEINDEVAGGIGLEFRNDVYRKSPAVGYWLAEQYWGRGIMPEAVRLITDHAFREWDIICILAFTLGKNKQSMRVLEKAGYERQGVIKRSVVKDNQILDEHIFAAYRQVLN